MKTSTSNFLKCSLLYGALFGLVMILYAIILYLFKVTKAGIWQNLVIGVVSIIILTLGLVISAKRFRNRYNDGYISYGSALIFSLIVLISASVIAAVYNYIFNAWIDPDYAREILDRTKEQMADFMYNMGLPDHEIDEALKSMDERAKLTPLTSALNLIYSNFLLGGIIALITSILLRKEEPMFENEAQVNENKETY